MEELPLTAVAWALWSEHGGLGSDLQLAFLPEEEPGCSSCFRSHRVSIYKTRDVCLYPGVMCGVTDLTCFAQDSAASR